jgi:hypothetical protein
MNTPELTLKELQEMEHDLKQYYGGCFPFGERKLESLLSLARLQIESQGVTRKSGGPSSTLPASSDTGGADVPPADPRLSPPNVWWSYHKKSGTWYDEPAAHNEIPSTSEYEDIECRCIPIGPLQTADQSPPIHTEESRQPLPEPAAQVPLEASDWLRGGPWWIAPAKNKFQKVMVVEVNDEELFYREGFMTHKRAREYVRSNDGITWLPCSKSA